MESRNTDRLDQWLDKALHEYGSAEPRVGLENCILSNLAMQKALYQLGPMLECDLT